MFLHWGRRLKTQSSCFLMVPHLLFTCSRTPVFLCIFEAGPFEVTTFRKEQSFTVLLMLIPIAGPQTSTMKSRLSCRRVCRTTTTSSSLSITSAVNRSRTHRWRPPSVTRYGPPARCPQHPVHTKRCAEQVWPSRSPWDGRGLPVYMLLTLDRWMDL